MSNQIKISYIIPAYNAEKVLTRAVDSILHGATIGSVEVIIVENGSGDETTRVAEELMARYNTNRDMEDGSLLELVRLCHSEKGVSPARNCGLLQAKGEWVAFVDADDQITEEGIHLMILDSLTSKADMIVYSHMAGTDKLAVVNGPIEYFSYDETKIEAVRVRMIANPTRYMQAWGKLFRRETVREAGTLFNPQIPLSEDSDFVLRFSRHCKMIDFSSAIVYRYTVDTPSTIRAYDGTKARRFAEALTRSSEAVKDESPAIRKAFNQYVLMNMNIVMVREVWMTDNPHTEEEKMAEEKRVATTPVFAAAIKATKFWQCRSARMAPILCLKLHWYRLASVIYKKRVSDNEKLSDRSGIAEAKEQLEKLKAAEQNDEEI